MPHLVHLARTIQENQRLLSISHVHSQAGGRTFDASLNFLGNSLFQDSPFETSDAPQVALHLARALQLYPPPILAVSADPPLPILCTPRTSCRHCSSALTLRKRPTEPFWLVDSASPAERVLVAHLTCTNRHCRAVHHPDHVEYDDTDGPMWMWEAEPDAIKVGQRVWVTKGFARHFRMLLLEQAVSPGGFAALWNKLYAESRSEPEPSTPDEPLDPSFFDTDSEDSPDDEEKSTSRPRSSFFRLTSHHVWRSFVLYSCILVSSASSHTFTSSPRPSIADLVALGNSTLFGSGIANVHDLSPHHCSTCSKPRRRWLGGPATEAEREKGVLWAGTSHRTEVEVRCSLLSISNASTDVFLAGGRDQTAWTACPTRRLRRYRDRSSRESRSLNSTKMEADDYTPALRSSRLSKLPRTASPLRSLLLNPRPSSRSLRHCGLRSHSQRRWR